jgi:hypothetical protein
MSSSKEAAALAMASLLGGGALQDRPYPTSGRLIRAKPIKTFKMKRDEEI